MDTGNQQHFREAEATWRKIRLTEEDLGSACVSVGGGEGGGGAIKYRLPAQTTRRGKCCFQD